MRGVLGRAAHPGHVVRRARGPRPRRALVAVVAAAQRGRPRDPGRRVTDLVNTLLGGLLGCAEVSGEGLQEEVAEAGGLPFKDKVAVAFLRRAELGAYLRELFDDEYPEALARRTSACSRGSTSCPRTPTCAPLRARVLEENVAGFYDERPGKRRLYAVSDDRRSLP